MYYIVDFTTKILKENHQTEVLSFKKVGTTEQNDIKEVKYRFLFFLL